MFVLFYQLKDTNKSRMNNEIPFSVESRTQLGMTGQNQTQVE